ncbi:hypothetical protein [Burkholderia sp. Ac-20365]|uniref:hypothetical protein n=1 Tax=Burkholderia sp. Ac-20365 TaxID=2703897 RepID=UPI00197C1B0A|nr:hypothetical protein [Burkholderia sp. Ac-20365]MBN3761177.1 hypothetical protein [Burkholderia sp. Ac-20365]
MKHLVAVASIGLAISAHAAGTIQSTGTVTDVFTGNSAGWQFEVSKDRHEISYAPREQFVTATNLLVMTDEGVLAYDISKNGAVTQNNDRRLLADSGVLEVTPVRVVVLEFPSAVRKVEWTRSLATLVHVVIKGNYLAAKYAAPVDSALVTRMSKLGPRRLTVTTDAGTYTFDVASGSAGAPIYKVKGQTDNK